MFGPGPSMIKVRKSQKLSSCGRSTLLQGPEQQFHIRT